MPTVRGYGEKLVNMIDPALLVYPDQVAYVDRLLAKAQKIGCDPDWKKSFADPIMFAHIPGYARNVMLRWWNHYQLLYVSGVNANSDNDLQIIVHKRFVDYTAILETCPWYWQTRCNMARIQIRIPLSATKGLFSNNVSNNEHFTTNYMLGTARAYIKLEGNWWEQLNLHETAYTFNEGPLGTTNFSAYVHIDRIKEELQRKRTMGYMYEP